VLKFAAAATWNLSLFDHIELQCSASNSGWDNVET
jgi:hypothetical protein